jgi:hypothetical protein
VFPDSWVTHHGPARAFQTIDPLARMRECGHPFILGTECDTLHVEGAAETIRAQLERMLEPRAA